MSMTYKKVLLHSENIALATEGNWEDYQSEVQECVGYMNPDFPLQARLGE